jgi:hypothetical protein
MAPGAVTFPHRRFVLTQTVGGVETNVIVSPPLAANFTTDATERVAALAQANQSKVLTPGVLYKLYSPSNGGAHTDGDLVWRSDIDYGEAG